MPNAKAPQPIERWHQDRAAFLLWIVDHPIAPFSPDRSRAILDDWAAPRIQSGTYRTLIDTIDANPDAPFSHKLDSHTITVLRAFRSWSATHRQIRASPPLAPAVASPEPTPDLSQALTVAEHMARLLHPSASDPQSPWAQWQTLDTLCQTLTQADASERLTLLRTWIPRHFSTDAVPLLAITDLIDAIQHPPQALAELPQRKENRPA